MGMSACLTKPMFPELIQVEPDLRLERLDIVRADMYRSGSLPVAKPLATLNH